MVSILIPSTEYLMEEPWSYCSLKRKQFHLTGADECLCHNGVKMVITACWWETEGFIALQIELFLTIKWFFDAFSAMLSSRSTVL